jgi:hypothetical protein
MNSILIEWWPLLPIPWLVAFVTISLALLLIQIQRGLPWRWRLAALSVMMLFFLNPQRLEQQPNPKPQEILVLVDESQSNGLMDRASETKRLEKLVQGALDKRPHTEWHIKKFGGTGDSRILPLLITTNIRQLNGVVVISDGALMDNGKDIKDLLGDVPLNMLLTDMIPKRDRRLTVDYAPLWFN